MIKVKLSYLRIAPRKVRLVADLIRGLSVLEAEKQLRFLTKRAAKPLLKLLRSAIANAKENYSLDKESLYISQIQVNQGPSLKRWQPRARGVSTTILKRTSQIILVLDSQKGTLRPVSQSSPVKKTEPALADQKKEEKVVGKELRRKDRVKKTRERTYLIKQPRESLGQRAFKGIKKVFRRKSI